MLIPLNIIQGVGVGDIRSLVCDSVRIIRFDKARSSDVKNRESPLTIFSSHGMKL
jgi:hypothetical protein